MRVTTVLLSGNEISLATGYLRNKAILIAVGIPVGDDIGHKVVMTSSSLFEKIKKTTSTMSIVLIAPELLWLLCS